MSDNKPTPARTTAQVAYEHGYEDYTNGHGIEDNPYMSDALRDAWEKGWRQAQADRNIPQPITQP